MNVWVIFVIITGILIYVGSPFFRRRKGDAETLTENDSPAHLYANLDTLIRTLKDLEFDFQIGRVSEEDFEQGTRRYRREAVAVLKDIDSMERDGEAVCSTCGAAVGKDHQFCRQCGSRLAGKKPPASDQSLDGEERGRS